MKEKGEGKKERKKERKKKEKKSRFIIANANMLFSLFVRLLTRHCYVRHLNNNKIKQEPPFSKFCQIQNNKPGSDLNMC